MIDKSKQIYAYQLTHDLDLMCECGQWQHVSSKLSDDGEALHVTCPNCNQSWAVQLLVQKADPPTMFEMVAGD